MEYRARHVEIAGARGGLAAARDARLDHHLVELREPARGNHSHGVIQVVAHGPRARRGPPLAVLRTTASAWPVSFHLADSMAMIPSRRLSQFDKVVIEARISRSGQATPSAGDLYVTSPVLHPAPGQKLALVISREIG